MTATRSSIEAIQSRWGLWPAQVLWFLLAVLVGQAVGGMIETQDSNFKNVVEVAMWLGWFVGLVALLAPSTVSLTIIRVLAPIVPIGVAVTALITSTYGPDSAVAAVSSLAAAAVVFLPQTGDLMINGSSYGAERRLALRPPAGALLGPIQIAWLACAFGLVTGPLLLASERWILGLVAMGAGAGLLFWGGRALHQLSKRWIVFVPVGFVIHDYYVLAESILLQRKTVTELGPAPAQPVAAADLSGGALGLALQVSLTEPTPIAVKNKRAVESTKAPKLIFTPSLPGRLLAEARVRGLKLA